MQYLLQMSSSTSAWLLSPLECSPQKQHGWTRRFCFWGRIMWNMYNKAIIEFGFRMISWIIKTSCLCYLPQPSASADNTDTKFWWFMISYSTSSNNCLIRASWCRRTFMMFSLYQLTSSHRSTCWSFQQIGDEGQVVQLNCLQIHAARRE